jgi:predicted ATP-dependent protease
MANQIQVLLDQKVYDRLQELQVVPLNSINDVIERLLFHGGHKSKEVVDLEAEEKHFSLEEEIERTRAGVYDTAGA